MNLFTQLFNKTKYSNTQSTTHEFCTRCDANLTLQKGYSNTLPYWVCKGCGEMLINPEVPGDVAWICDKCEAMLNIQQGFSEECGSWTCTECGYSNKIDKSELYLTDEEYQSACNNPYKGLADQAALELSSYTELELIGDRSDIILVRSMDDDRLYVKKILTTYDVDVYRQLMNNPVDHMPKIHGVYESDNALIIIEDYVEGKTLLELINEDTLDPIRAAYIARRICYTARELHTADTPVIHRDIKPSNIIINSAGEAHLLDINAAKLYKEDEIEDTRLLGTQYYAAPEQLGYGMSASSEKTDIYAIGVLLNVMITGKLPKEQKAPEPIWSIVERCISLEPADRYADDELISALDSILR